MTVIIPKYRESRTNLNDQDLYRFILRESNLSHVQKYPWNIFSVYAVVDFPFVKNHSMERYLLKLNGLYITLLFEKNLGSKLE